MLYAIVAVIALILDQLLKYWTTISIVENTGIKKLIPGVIHLTNLHNKGAAFSFLQGARWFFVILCVVFVAAVIYLLVKNIISTPGARWCAVIVMAGAVGNCIDRIISGYVVDMLEFDFKIFGLTFPVFNLADICITCGVIAFCIFLLVEKPETETATKDSGEKAKETSAQPVAAPRSAVSVVPKSPRAKSVERTTEPDPAGSGAEWRPPVPKAETAARTGPVTYTQPAAAGKAQPQLTRAPVQTAGPKPVPEPKPKPAEKARSIASAAERIDGLGHETGASKTEQVMRVLVNGNPPPSAPAASPAPAPASAPKAAAEAEPSYDLDDILAEFRDL